MSRNRIVVGLAALVLVAGFAPAVFARISNPGGGSSGSGSSVTVVSTSTSETSGRVPYWTTTSGSPAKLGEVSTSSITLSGIIAGGTLGSLLGGTNVTLTAKVSTSTSPTIGHLAYWTSNGTPNLLGSVATTSVACSGFISCTGFYAFGAASTIGVTGTLGITNGGTNASSFASNVLLGYNGTAFVATGTPQLTIGTLLATSSTATSTFMGGVNFRGSIQLSATSSATSTTIVLDWANSLPQVEYRIGTDATSVTLINATTSTQWGSRKLVWICNPGASAGALTWAGVEWIGSAPTQTTTADQCDIYSFVVTRATSTTAYKVAGSQGAGFQ